MENLAYNILSFGKTLDSEGLKSLQTTYMGQPQCYELALMEYAKQPILHFYVSLEKKMAGFPLYSISIISYVQHTY